VEQFVGVFQGRDGLGAVAASAQAFGVDAHRSERIARPDQIRRDILADGAGAAYHGVRAYARKLMYGGQSTQNRPVADMNVAGKLHTVGNDGMVAYLAIVGDVRISHDPVVIAQAGNTYILRRACIDGDVFPYGVTVADLEPRGLTRIFL